MPRSGTSEISVTLSRDENVKKLALLEATLLPVV